MARCVGIELFTVAMDLEGTDSNERGQVLAQLAAIYTAITFSCNQRIWFWLTKLRKFQKF